MGWARIFAVIFFLNSQLASAFAIIAPKDQTAFDPNRPTHIFVIGYAGGLGDQLFRVAKGRATRYQELYPDHQIVYMGPSQIDYKSEIFNETHEYIAVLRLLGLRSVEHNKEYLTSKIVMQWLEYFKAISSLEFISHSAAHKGVGLDAIPSEHPFYKLKRFNQYIEGIDQLKDNFLDDAFVFLHGCNSGFLLAPDLAKLWQVPTAGSLSFTNFQEFFVDNQWYFNDEGKFPEGLLRYKRNHLSFGQSQPSCISGHCHRMKPEPYPYSGFWGTLSAGLSHYKFFCGEESADYRCRRAMARALLPFLGNLYDGQNTNRRIRNLAKDYLCPDSSRLAARADCWAKLEDGYYNRRTTYTGMVRGKTLNCDFERCKVKIECGDEAGSCKILEAIPNPYPRTMIEEYKALVRGFNALSQGPLAPEL